MLIDSHAHLPHNLEKTSQILKNAKSNGVTKIINIGTSLEDGGKAIQIAERFEDIYVCVGIYPHDEMKTSINQLKNKLESLLTSSKKVVGVGECGIDITNWQKTHQQDQRPLQSQIELFEMQIKLAIKHNLPLVIHNRNGDKHVLNLLEKYAKPDYTAKSEKGNRGNERLRAKAQSLSSHRGELRSHPRAKARGLPAGNNIENNLKFIIHCFDSDLEFAQKIINLGGFISFSGFITYKNKNGVHETAKNIPLEKILVETDAPYILPKQLQIKKKKNATAKEKNPQNESKNVKIVAETLADIKFPAHTSRKSSFVEKGLDANKSKNLPFEKVCSQTYENTCKLFGLEK